MLNNIPKRLKLIQAGYGDYTGPIGEYNFVNGVSEEYIPLTQRDRLAAAMIMEEVNDDGSTVDAGAPARILRERAAQAEIAAPLERATEESLIDEQTRAVLGQDGFKVKPIYTKEVLESVASEKGIAGLRVLAKHWNVKSKSIPDLIILILNAQSEYARESIDTLVKRGISVDSATIRFAEINEVPAFVFLQPLDDDPVQETKYDEGQKIVQKVAQESTQPQTSSVEKAAISGDLSAAVSQE